MGGNSLHDLSAADDHLKGFEALVSADPYDENAALIMSFAFAAGQGSFIVNYMVHTTGEENPPVFDKLRSIPSLHSTLRFDKLSGMATELGVLSPNGMRYALS